MPYLDDWVSTPHILDGEARIPRWSLALDERRDLLFNFPRFSLEYFGK